MLLKTKPNLYKKSVFYKLLPMKPPIKVYIAGPYTSRDAEKRKENMQKAREIGTQIMKMGHHPYCPHTHTGTWEDSSGLAYEEFMQLHLTILESWAEAMFFIGSSPGADREKAKAEALGIPVFTSIEQFKEFATAMKPSPTGK